MTYLLTDVLCITATLVVTKLIYIYILDRSLAVSYLELIGFLTIALISFISLFLMTNVYEDTVKNQGHISLRVFAKMNVDIVLGSIFVGALLFYMQVEMSRLFIIYFIGVMIISFVINRLILHRIVFKDKSDNQAVRNILIVGQSSLGMKYIQEIRNHEYLNFNIVGYVNINQTHTYPNLKHIGSIDELEDLVRQYMIDEIAVVRPLSYDPRLKDVLNHCQDMGITVTMILDLQNADTSKAHVAMIGSIPVLKFHTVSLNEGQLYAKRMLDVIGGLFGMMIFGVAYLIIGPLIKLETPGPVIFKQKRVGKNGRVFEVWKFRSMGVNAEAQKVTLLASNEMSGHMFKMTNDPRVTRVGAFIRKTSLDELPQFYNVLKGDMSLVGTRPPTENEVKAYDCHHHRRISITPGITGNWQVSGRSDIEDFEEVVRLDSEYIANWSVWLDIKILFKTVQVVVAGRGSK